MTSIRVLKNFIAITRHPSVAAAAREIGLTPLPRVSNWLSLKVRLGLRSLIVISVPWSSIITVVL